ncbi:nucleoside deaminase [Pseudoglutamicibacter albus]|uniref:tRNA-specific adenosine deaminase n=1 Tax=Pseudoglutamicibacter albus TaxID=98671 RepID=A0ABU1YX80_9MICC|nr:nucleoside deaminase [Pseudoglutamicibacter albus]MDR7292937.1 tRNA(adenine34) deaminase [Pseudoglutamicibacter albus]
MPIKPPDGANAWMGAALEEARAAAQHGDIPIGAVIVGPDGRIVARGHNIRERDGDPTGHAEVVAIREAARALASNAGNPTGGDGGAASDRGDDDGGDGWRLTDCTLVVTLEPCPMCAGAIVLARIPRVIFGAWDEKAGATGSVMDILREPRLNHRAEVFAGVQAGECQEILQEFFATMRSEP